MKIPVIKQLVEAHSVQELRAAEDALLDEQTPAIEIPGDDEGEQLTHVLAAVWIHHYMDEHAVVFPVALREYTKKVRVSIS
jgi:hypothetical protein